MSIITDTFSFSRVCCIIWIGIKKTSSFSIFLAKKNSKFFTKFLTKFSARFLEKAFDSSPVTSDLIDEFPFDILATSSCSVNDSIFKLN